MPDPDPAIERQRIRELHKRVDRGRVQPCCEGCELECDRCHEWPCPTIRLLDGDDGE